MNIARIKTWKYCMKNSDDSTLKFDQIALAVQGKMHHNKNKYFLKSYNVAAEVVSYPAS